MPALLSLHLSVKFWAKSLLSQAVNEALSSVDDGVTARAIENRLLEEQAAQLLSRGDRQVYQSEIANSQRIIENLTEQRAQILAEEPTGSGKALSRARSDKQARLRDIDQRIRQAQERTEFSRNALAPHEPGGQFLKLEQNWHDDSRQKVNLMLRLFHSIKQQRSGRQTK